MVVVYLAHPIGETNGTESVRRGDNIANAVAWVRFLADQTRWAISCPWYMFAIAIGEYAYAQRRLVDQLTILDRSDLLVLAGGYISPHMALEVRRATRHGIPVVDLTAMGISPPVDDDATAELVMAKVKQAVALRPRRVWLPLLTETELVALKGAMGALLDDHEDAIAIIDRIVAAATEVMKRDPKPEK